MTGPARLAPLVVAAAAVAVGLRPAAPPPVPAGRPVAVTAVSAVCPDLRQGARTVTRVGVAVGPGPRRTAPAGAGRAGDGVTAAPLSTGAADALPLRMPGDAVGGVGAALDGDALVVTARGPLAAGLAVEQVGRDRAGPGRGLAAVRCAPPGGQAWFVGGDATVGRAGRLVLVNVDDTAAVVDVAAWGAADAAEPAGARGLTVPPRSRLAVPLDELAPGRRGVALHVRAVRGRVAAALRVTRYDGRTPGGVDWVPLSPPPAAEVVVPGVPAGPGRRVLLVANPGADPTVVRVRLTGAAGLREVVTARAVPAGGSIAVDLSAVVAGGPAAALVSAAGPPVLAAVEVTDGSDGGFTDVAYAGAAAPLAGPAPLTAPAAAVRVATTLLLSAPDRAARVQVGPSGTPGRTVTVGAGRTVALGAGTGVQVRPLPGSGPVYAARLLRDAGGRRPWTALLALPGPAPAAAAPRVREDPGLAVTGR